MKKNAPSTKGSESATTHRDSIPTRRRQPAYARVLRDALQAGRVPRHGVAVFLDDRLPARSAFVCIACFSDSDPLALDWSVCRNLDVIIPNSDRADHDRLQRLIQALEKVRPRRLQLWKSDGSVPEFLVLGEVAR